MHRGNVHPQVLAQILHNAGRVLIGVDELIVNDTRNGEATCTGTQSNIPGIIDSQDDLKQAFPDAGNDWSAWPDLTSEPAPTDTDKDGMPDAWESNNGLNPGKADNNNHDLDPDYTTERMVEALRLLREEYRFGGYIHAKAIPGADPCLTYRLGLLADRLSVNIELPSAGSLALLAPDKKKEGIFAPMGQIRDSITASRGELKLYRHAPRFAPAGQSTQMIVGATPESDRQILALTQSLYDRYHLKRVFYSAYMPVSNSPLLPAPQGFQPPLLREHRLYQADWLLRYYHFRAEEILDEDSPDLDPRLDPKCTWALRHLEFFPVEVNRADYEALLRVPGVGVKSARRILAARRVGPLTFQGLKRLGVVLKRAQYFLTCSGRPMAGLKVREDGLLRHLAALDAPREPVAEQLSLFDPV